MLHFKDILGVKKSTALRAQVLLEFTFSMIVVALMIFAIIMILRWAGVDLAERRIAHDAEITRTDIETDYLATEQGFGPLRQIDPYFYDPIDMNAVWDGN